ncbi:hypothetical protein [Micromonospora sp. IBSANI012]|uniref:hypothetical protein n=1 Tax=Micromonospora sp. IBSANI012 TaxID=3457761 RepID=UPI00405A0C00
MPPPPHRPSALAWRVFRGSEAVRRGLPTRHQLRGASWIRLRQNVYADARLDRDHALACQATVLRLPPEAVIAGPSAAYLHGVTHAAGFGDVVHVRVPRTVRLDSVGGIRVHTSDAVIPSGQFGVDGAARIAAALPRSDPAQAAWETAAWLEPVRAVGIVDALLGMGLTSRDALAETASRQAHRPGGRRAARVFELADPGAQSPPGSHLRVRLVLGGLPRPVTQHPVRLPCGLVLHPDLAWPEFRVAVEYDGQWHADSDQLHRDRRRLNQLVAAGWIVLHVTSRRLRGDFPALLRETRTALAALDWRR